jgi:crotonobetainyl-CoA:carnitine CoA-transferase CaiB-like acyl-CoA transferase
MTLPLSGCRIIAVEQYGAGPYGSAFLADLGADVIKIEQASAGGDMARTVGPFFLGEGDSQFFQTFNRNKRSLALDLKHEKGREVLVRLAATADGLMGNLRGDQPDKLGLTYDDLKAANPAIVCAHLSAYGRDGERAGWPGYDYLMQAEAGFLSLTGEPDGPPARFGLSIVDFMTGMTCAFALVSGILAARTRGRGRDLDVSLFDVAMHQLSYPATWYLNDGLETGRTPRSGHPYIVPSQLFRTADGWLMLMCQTQKFWEILCQRIGRPELIDDERFRGYGERHANREVLEEILDDTLSRRTTAQWLELFAGDLPAAPVHDIAQALDNPWFRGRGGVQEVPHPDRADLQLLNNPIRMSEPIPNRPGPKVGQHSDEILQELGYGAEEIAALRDAGAV